MRSLTVLDHLPQSSPVSRATVRALAQGVASCVLVLLAAAAWRFWPAGGASPSDPPHARIFVLVEHKLDPPVGAGMETLRSGDRVHVAVVGEPGLFTSLLNLDSQNRLLRIGPKWDEPLTADPQPLAHRFEADAVPGRERLLVVASRSPLGDLDSELNTVNGDPELSRATRLTRLRTLLVERFGDTQVAIHAGQELRHVD